MDPKLQKLSTREANAEEVREQQTSSVQTQAREFGTVEELLRHDAAQNPPPAALADRVAKSIEQVPAPARSWLSRWFTRKSTGV